MQFIRRKPWVAIFAALIISLASLPAHAKDTAQQAAARRAIIAQYAAKDRAIQDKDLNAYASLLAPDYVYYGVLRIPIAREQHLALQASNFRQPKTDAYKVHPTTIRSIQWRGPDAIVMMQTGVDMNLKEFSYHANFLTRDYWGFIDGRWQLRQSADVKYWGNSAGYTFSYGG